MKDETKPPLIVFPHGGPHSAFLSDFSLSSACLCKLGFAILGGKVYFGVFFLYYYFFSPFFLITRLKSRLPLRRAVKVYQILYLECCQHDEILKTTFSAEMKRPNLTRRRLAVECLTSLTTANYKPRSPTDPNSPHALHLSPTLRYVPAK